MIGRKWFKLFLRPAAAAVFCWSYSGPLFADAARVLTPEEQLNGVQPQKGLIDRAKDFTCGALGWFCGDKGKTPPEPKTPVKGHFVPPAYVPDNREFKGFDGPLVKPGELPVVPPEEKAVEASKDGAEDGSSKKEDGQGMFNVQPGRKDGALAKAIPGFAAVKGTAYHGRSEDLFDDLFNRKIQSKALLDIKIEGADAAEMEIIRNNLGKFSEKDLKSLAKSGVRFVVDRKRAPPSENTDDYSTYDRDKKIVNLAPAKGRLSEEIGPIILHETGHALDDIRRKDDSSGFVRRVSDIDNEELFKIYRKHLDKHRTGSLDPENEIEAVLIRPERKDGVKSMQNNMRSTDEYLAMGIEFYLASDASRGELREKDPDLYRYVRQFLSS